MTVLAHSESSEIRRPLEALCAAGHENLREPENGL